MLACALSLLALSPTYALDTSPAVNAPAAPRTLDRALADAEPPKEDVFLTVAADTVMLPKGFVTPSPGLTVPQVADGYGRLIQTFETVTALAPPTMTLLNTDPGTPNPYDGMPPSDALKLLLGSLSDGQWQAITGASGLSQSDLTDDKQRSLFLALFPGGTLTVSSQLEAGSQGSSEAPIKLTADDLKAAHLRLGQRVQIGLPIEGKTNSTLIAGSGLATTGGKPSYVAWGSSNDQAQDTLYGVKIRDTVPNALKPSDLDYDTEGLKTPVTLAGVKTVADLVSRIGGEVKIEIYADRRFEKRPVTLMGPTSARAKDLLRALALCVCGTYRKVGTAYVLTNDVQGLGPRLTILTRFAQDADIARQAALAEAGDTLITARGGVDGLPALDGTLGFNAAQRALGAKNGGYQVGQGTTLNGPLAQLTPQQQDYARQQVQQWNASQQAQTQPNGSGVGRLTLGGQFYLSAQPTLLLEVPAVPGSVTLNFFDAWRLFQPSHKLQDEYQQKRQKEQEAEWKAHPPVNNAPTQPAPPPPTLTSLFARIPRRAILARPRTASDVDALVASMRVIGLNQLWLDVFSGGASHLGGKPDILTEALARTRGTGIAVIPTLDLLNWGGNAPEEARDLTLMGEDSGQTQARQQHYNNIVYQGMTSEEADKQSVPVELSVCPDAPSVQKFLTEMVGKIAATPGVAALALRETVMPGYDHPTDSQYGTSGDGLGYVVPLRLSFLRRDHVDPLDLETNAGGQGVNLNLSLPEFEDRGELGAADKDWNGFRVGVNKDFLGRLLSAAQQSANRRIPFLIRQRRSIWQGDWYGLWNDARGTLPELSEKLSFEGSGPDVNYAAFAHSQCRLDIVSLPAWFGSSQESLAMSLQQMKPGWDGFVLDFSTAGGDPLAGLARSMTPLAAPPAIAGRKITAAGGKEHGANTARVSP